MWFSRVWVKYRDVVESMSFSSRVSLYVVWGFVFLVFMTVNLSAGWLIFITCLLWLIIAVILGAWLRFRGSFVVAALVLGVVAAVVNAFVFGSGMCDVGLWLLYSGCFSVVWVAGANGWMVLLKQPALPDSFD